MFVATEGSHDATGGTVGGQIGYRWQASQWVFGLEAQGNWADFHGRNRASAFPAFSNDTRVDAFGLFTGQVGVAFNNALLYVKGGAAVTSDRYRATSATGTGIRSPTRLTTPAGVAWSASAWNTASPRTGRSRSSTITCSCRTRPTPSPTTATSAACWYAVRHRTHPSGRRSGYRPHQLPLGWPGRREVLIFPTRSQFSYERPALRRPFCLLVVRAFSQPCAEPAAVSLYRLVYPLGYSILRVPSGKSPIERAKDPIRDVEKFGMKKFVSGSVALVALMAAVASASAADLAARPYTKAPAVDPTFNWSGFYIGAHAGYGWAREDHATWHPRRILDLRPRRPIRRRAGRESRAAPSTAARLATTGRPRTGCSASNWPATGASISRTDTSIFFPRYRSAERQG